MVDQWQYIGPFTCIYTLSLGHLECCKQPVLQVIQTSGGVDLAKSVLVPLLTREAIEFLHTSGTPEERHLWVTLGDGWTKCR